MPFFARFGASRVERALHRGAPRRLAPHADARVEVRACHDHARGTGGRGSPSRCSQNATSSSSGAAPLRRGELAGWTKQLLAGDAGEAREAAASPISTSFGWSVPSSAARALVGIVDLEQREVGWTEAEACHGRSQRVPGARILSHVDWPGGVGLGSAAPMQKDQRLLDLAAFLLKAAEPVSWREIQEQFPEDYGGKGEAAIRKFERDKAELLELGIPVRYVAGDEDLPAGYLIDRDEFYLPDLKLPPEDLALLYLAGSAALASGTFPYARDLAHALNKLSFAARAPGASEAAGLAARQLSAPEDGDGARTSAARVEELSRAIAHMKRVHLVYLGAERRERDRARRRSVRPVPAGRRVVPRGLVPPPPGDPHVPPLAHRVAHRERRPRRARATSRRARTSRSPTLATRETWEYDVHAPVRCRVRLDPPVPAEVVASFGPRAKLARGRRRHAGRGRRDERGGAAPARARARGSRGAARARARSGRRRARVLAGLARGLA